MFFLGQPGYPGPKGEKGISVKGQQGYPGRDGYVFFRFWIKKWLDYGFSSKNRILLYLYRLKGDKGDPGQIGPKGVPG